ncbi:MAG: NAD-dependent DNA ligase LigA, partial [Muribaculaceae bacterium]|nr:NAD-dependent DNA ligase LigA [Muribaculaceae bacterium]
KDERLPESPAVSFVAKCPACGTPLVRVEGEAAWVCPNKWGCPPQITGRIEHFVGRRMMNIDGIGEETAEILYATGLVKNIADIYGLTKEKLMTLERFGEKSAERIMKGIEDSRSVPFDRVVYALSIPYVGETTAKKIARSAGSMDALMAMDRTQLEGIEDVGPRIADSILDYFESPVNRENIERLRAAGLKFEADKVDDSLKGDALQGKSIVISGVFNHHSRDEYKEMIANYGGKNVGSISKKTDFVLAGDNMGPAKLEKANKLGVRIIDEDTFLKILAGDENID